MMKQIEHGAGKVVVGALVVAFALSLLKSIGGHNTPAAAAAAARPAPAATVAARPRAASTTAAPLVVVFPSLTTPGGLTSGRVEYALEGAARTGYGEYGQWVKIGTAGLPSSTTSFSSLPVASLSANLPAQGLSRESWTLWVRVKSAGDQMFAIQIQAPAHAVAALHVDGQGSAVVNLDNNGVAGRQIGIGQIDLGKGWHMLTLSVVHSSEQQPTAVRAEVFMRGPKETTPANFTPYAPASPQVPVSAPDSAAKPGPQAPATQAAPAATPSILTKESDT